VSASGHLVITGAGAVCGAGLTIDAIWNAIRDGRCAIAPITQWDAFAWPARFAAEVTGIDNRTLVDDRKLHKIISRTDLFGLYAAGVAIQQSGLIAHREALQPDAAAHFADRSGVFAGSGGGTYQNTYDFFPLLSAAEGRLPAFGRELGGTVNPMWLLKHLPNNVLCHVGIRHGFKGTNACITNQCVGGAMAVAEAASAIRAGEADRAVAVGHDAPIEPETVFHYHRLGLLSTKTLRPFDRERSGTVFGEGAAAVILEKADDARARGATILGEFLGSGCVTEGTGLLAVRPDGEGMARAIQIALQDAGVSRESIGLVVAHGNGTRNSDASEAEGIRRAFNGSPPPVTAFKWAFGHLIAGSGVIDMVLALAALREGFVPGIPTLNSPDPDIAPFPVSSKPQTPGSRIGLICCRGFGAMNVALVVRAEPQAPEA